MEEIYEVLNAALDSIVDVVSEGSKLTLNGYFTSTLDTIRSAWEEMFMLIHHAKYLLDINRVLSLVVSL